MGFMFCDLHVSLNNPSSGDKLSEVSNMSNTGWVVTWFLLGYTVRMFEYTVRTF